MRCLLVVFILIQTYPVLATPDKKHKRNANAVIPAGSMNPGGPGASIIITKKGLDYANLVAGDRLNQLLNSQSRNIQDFRHEFNGGHVETRNLHITDLKTPNFAYHLHPPSKLKWGFVQGSIKISGDFTVKKKFLGIPAQISGNMKPDIRDIAVHITAEFGKSADGKPTLTYSHCHAVIGELNLNIGGGVAVSLVGLFESSIANKLRYYLETEVLCKLAKTYIDNRANPILEQYKIFLPFHYEAKNLTLDMRLTKSPTTSDNVVESSHKGEVSTFASGGTPFYPFPLDKKIDENSMINIFISDYVINSYFYHYHTAKGIRVIEKNNSRLALRNCTICLGFLVPEIAGKYSDYDKVIARARSLEAPILQILDNKATATLKAIIELYAKDENSEEEVFILGAMFTTSGEAEGFRLNEFSIIVGEIQVTQFDIRLLNSTVEFDGRKANPLENLSTVLIKSTVEKMVSDIFKQGVPLKLTPGVSLSNVRFELGNRTLRIYSDVLYTVE